MFRATIQYVDGRIHFVIASTLGQLKSKCKPFTNEKDVEIISVDKIEPVGYIKHTSNLVEPI